MVVEFTSCFAASSAVIRSLNPRDKGGFASSNSFNLVAIRSFHRR